MTDDVADSSPISRRGVLFGTAALATAATSLPVGLSDIPGFPICRASVATAAPLPRAGTSAGPAKYRRWSISDPDIPPRVIDSYKKAVRAMLALPPTDPRNWYRHMLIHALDCPHANWWFLPWHRGYLGWFERICRDLSGDPQFALPYWDWTKEPRVPKQMFEDVLNPNDPAFIKSAAEFRAKFTDPIAKAGYWSLVRNPDGSQGPSPQFDQLMRKFVRFPQDLWFDMLDSPMGAQWFDQPNARGLTAAQPELTIPRAPADQQAVLVAISSQTISDALAPRDFVAFGGARSNGHGSPAGSGVLEGQPHNLVHSCVGGVFNGTGGFMSANLSPVDPIFFLHHANVDRLWDVWTRKQLALNLPILPDGYNVKPGPAPSQPGQPPGPPGQPPGQPSDYAIWAAESFMFYIDAKGKPVPQNTAGSYAAIGDFDYDYSPGTGEQVVPVTTPPALLAQFLQRPLVADLNSQSFAGSNTPEATVRLPLALFQQQAEPLQPKLFATVTLNLPQHGQAFDLFVDRADGSSQFVATLSMFGHHVMQGPVTFTVPLSRALDAVQSRDMTGGGQTLKFRVAPRSPLTAEAMSAHMRATLTPGSAGEVKEITLQQL